MFKRYVRSYIKTGAKNTNRAPASLNMEDVSVTYNSKSTPVISNFSLNVEAGEVLSVLGYSGCGKTTMLRAIAGHERIHKGYIRIGGLLMSSSFIHVEPNVRRVGLVFQDYALFPHLTIEQNVAFGLRDMYKEQRRQRLREMIVITGLSGLEKSYPNQLSGGQQQRVSLARSIAPYPKIVLLDEPFSNLDRELSEFVRREVKRIIKAARVTVILVTHNSEEALSLCDKIAVMNRKGYVEQIGKPEEVYNSPVSPEVARMVGTCKLVDGVVSEGGVVTEMGVFPILKYNNLSTGNRVTLLMRASELELTQYAQNCNGQIVFREFMGEFTEFGVKFASGASITIRQRSAVPYQVGDRVGIIMRKNAYCIAFKKP